MLKVRFAPSVTRDYNSRNSCTAHLLTVKTKNTAERDLKAFQKKFFKIPLQEYTKVHKNTLLWLIFYSTWFSHSKKCLKPWKWLKAHLHFLLKGKRWSVLEERLEWFHQDIIWGVHCALKLVPSILILLLNVVSIFYLHYLPFELCLGNWQIGRLSNMSPTKSFLPGVCFKSHNFFRRVDTSTEEWGKTFLVMTFGTIQASLVQVTFYGDVEMKKHILERWKSEQKLTNHDGKRLRCD